jgi:hypothetical protein
LFGTSLKYESPRIPAVRVVTTTDNDIPENEDFLEDAEAEEFDEFESGSDN